jgi:hypothetical protein
MVSSRFGPAFQEVTSVLYRLEYAVATVVLLLLLVTRGAFGGISDTLQTLFWLVLPT